MLMLTQVLLSCFGPQTHKVRFSMPYDPNLSGVSSVYISLDSGAYKGISSDYINPNGIRSSYIIFFKDGSFKAPISFDKTLYRLSNFYNKQKAELLYVPKKEWGRYKIDQNKIAFEVGMCEYTPSCKFRLKSGTFEIINDSTLKVDPTLKDNTYIFGKSTMTFNKIDSLDLSFINSAYAWHNIRDAKNKK